MSSFLVYIMVNLQFLPDLLSFVPVVATDDEKIAECCRGFGADVIMTSESCQNGKGISWDVSCF